MKNQISKNDKIYGKWDPAEEPEVAFENVKNGIWDLQKFKNFISCKHPGVNLGPWNLAMHKIEKINDKHLIDGKNLICYHYHGFKQTDNGCVNDTGWLVTPQNFDYLYETYNTLLKEV